MKYYKSSNFTKAITSTGFIAVISCLLIALGAIGWFALSRKAEITETPSKSNPEESYSDNNSSYTSQVELENNKAEEIENANESVSDIPYSQPQTTVPPEEKPTYVLPVTGNISKGFSDTALQYSATYDDMRLHLGVDILCEKGSNIKSIGVGSVKSIVEDAYLGKILTIEYNENITVKYCGMGSINVKENDNVNVGDIVGTLGEIPSECADNPHIHIEVIMDEKNVSPLEALELE